jgi:hypothetical protein
MAVKDPVSSISMSCNCKVATGVLSIDSQRSEIEVVIDLAATGTVDFRLEIEDMLIVVNL